MKSILLKFIIPLSIFLLISPFLCGFELYSVVHQWQQSENINYHSFDPYTLSVVKHRAYVDILDIFSSYAIFIGREEDPSSYGYMVEYDLHSAESDKRQYIDKCSVEWQNDGVWFVEPSGAKVFFPKALFIGGR